MDASGRQEEYVTGVDVEAVEHLRDAVFGHEFDVLQRGDGPVEPAQERGPRVGLDDVPHLGLALGTVVPRGCEAVVRMDLHG